MKKLNAVLFLLVFAAGVFAQTPFKLVNWVNMSATGKYAADLSTNPLGAEKLEITALKSKASFTIDLETIDEIGLEEIWGRLGAEQFVSKPTNVEGGDLYDLAGAKTFGASFKAFWDDENLYVILKYMDKNAQANAGSRAFEIAFQTKEIDRYEVGWNAATKLDGADGKNAQYGRFTELGGGKALFGSGGVTEIVASKGQTGAWGAAPGAVNAPAFSWNVTNDGTIWAVVAFSFADNLMFLTDEWGADETANHTALDPTVKTKINFEVKSNATTGDPAKKVEYWWSAKDNEGYALNYWVGYLNFSTDTWTPVSNDIMKAASRYAYIYDNTLKFKGYSQAVDVEIYSIVGQKVRSAKNVTEVNVSDLNTGIYMVKVGKDVFKVKK